MITPDLYTRPSRFICPARETANSPSVRVGLNPLVRIKAKQDFVEASTPPESTANIPFTKKPDAAAMPMAKNSEVKKKRLLLR